jgi:Fic-DOC domain mobile mystery protein B
MGLDLNYSKGQTPLDEDEKAGLLIASITTQGELDEHEQINIEKAVQWTLESRFKKDQILSESFVKKLHKRMYGDVWKWAGEFRKSGKNIGVEWTQIGPQLRQLLDNTRYWIENESYAPEEIAIRFKHKLVLVHCFPNGNGRHSRLMADIVIEHVFGKDPFSWKNSNLVDPNADREAYINALKHADNGEIKHLLDFAGDQN